LKRAERCQLLPEQTDRRVVIERFTFNMLDTDQRLAAGWAVGGPARSSPCTVLPDRGGEGRELRDLVADRLPWLPKPSESET
jgi:hypothetical protein